MPRANVTRTLRRLRQRAGLSIGEMAKEAGFRQGSSYQHYEDPGLFRRPYLPLEVAERFADVLEGRGEPSITRAEVYALAGVGDPTVAARAHAAPLEEAVLERVIVATEAYLQGRSLAIEPEKKAKLLLHLYRIVRDRHAEAGRSGVRSLDSFIKLQDIKSLVELIE